MGKLFLTRTSPLDQFGNQTYSGGNFYQPELAHSGPRLATQRGCSHLSAWTLHRTSKYLLPRPPKVVLQSTAGDSLVVASLLWWQKLRT